MASAGLVCASAAAVCTGSAMPMAARGVFRLTDVAAGLTGANRGKRRRGDRGAGMPRTGKNEELES